MLNNEKDLVTRLLKQNIVTLCKETVSYDTQLEIDGIICISAGNEAQQIVVKVHHFFQKLGAKSPCSRNPGESNIESKPIDHTWAQRRDEKRYPIINGQGIAFNQRKDGYFEKEMRLHTNDLHMQADGSLPSVKKQLVSPAHDDASQNVGEGNWQHINKTVSSSQIPKTIVSLEQEEHKKASNESSSDSEDDESGNDGKDNLSNPHIISFRENGDVISEVPGQSPVKVSSSDSPPSYETKSGKRHASPDESSMIECKLGKNSNTDEDMSKVPIRQVRDIPCKRCGAILSDGPAFEKHNTDIHSVYTCRVCFNTFTCRNNMKRHMRLHTGFRPYTCKLCSESFTRKDDIKRHLIRHSFDKPFRCNVCRKGYMDRKTVKNHIRKEHNSKIIHICQTCGEAFDNSLKFQDHKKNHPELKMFQCSLCNFTGSNLLTYNKHQLIHEVKKDYSCDPCDLIFGDPFRYTTHLRKHRTDPNFTSYRCCFCNLTLSSYDLFLRHEHTHDQPNKFTCYVCIKHFQSEAALKDHKACHPVYNNQNEAANNQLLPTVVRSQMIAQQPIFPTFMSQIASSIKQESNMSESVDDQALNDSNITEENIGLNPHEDMEEDDKKHDMRESMAIYDNDSSQIKIEPFDSSSNAQNDYWCAECQHGFATEEHLTEHIALAHENTNGQEEHEWQQQEINSPPMESRNDDQDYKIVANTDEIELSDDDSCDEFDDTRGRYSKMETTNSSPDSIRYTPVPIFSSKQNGKRSSTRKEHSSAENTNNQTTESTDILMDNINSDASNSPPTLESQEYTNGMNIDKVYEKWAGKKNYHAQSQFQCDICFMNFTEFEAFDLHNSNVHRKYVCHFCGKGFTSRPNRDRHVRYHTGEKPFKCEVCHQSFVRGDDLRYHRTSKHPDVKPYTCNFCGMSFPWAKDLEKHSKTHGIA